MDIIVCDTDELPILKYLTGTEIEGDSPSVVAVVKNWRPQEKPYRRLGIFIDLSCKENQLLLQTAEKHWFDAVYSWLVFDEGDLFRTFVKNALPLYPDVILLNADDELLQVTDDPDGSKSPVGFWNRSTDLVDVVFPEVIPNLRKKTFTASLYDVQNIYVEGNVSQRLQDFSYREGDDGGNRFFYSVVLHVADMYNFSIDLVRSKHWGVKQPNGTWTGIMGLLQSGETEFHLTPLLAVPQRLEVSYVLPSLQNYWFAVVIRQPRALGTYKAQLLELSLVVWVFVGVIMLIGAVVFTFTLKNEADSETSFDTGILQVIGIFSSQGLSIIPKSNSSRMACLFLMFVGLLVSNYYNAATMTALLRESPPTIKTLEELAKSRIPINLFNATYMDNKWARSKVFYPYMWDKIESDVRIRSMRAGLDAIRRGEAFCAESYVLFERINNLFTDDEKCSLTIFPSNLILQGMRYVIQDRHIREMLARGLTRTLEHGLAKKKRDEWIAEPPPCVRQIPFIHVKLESVTVAFVIFLIGLVLSAVIFVGEAINNLLLKRHKKKVRKI
ncbi:ionotropic glutamate receptor activity [Nesidiocoris tenuis]|uniref:Ionotropic glutamate receptor activity n=1 Tax=Nesidiocoris tenuis TaxID=355587 RepID=A0ABN7BBQ0_9HEMI|nr:ionotropic glutamate receptor activity [Nesidiocoris tenuis]